MTTFYYNSGEVVREGDFVAVAGRRAVIERVFSDRSAAAQDFACFETGGLLLKFEDGDVQVWPATDEDLEFRGRANTHR